MIPRLWRLVVRCLVDARVPAHHHDGPLSPEGNFADKPVLDFGLAWLAIWDLISAAETIFAELEAGTWIDNIAPYYDSITMSKSYLYIG